VTLLVSDGQQTLLDVLDLARNLVFLLLLTLEDVHAVQRLDVFPSAVVCFLLAHKLQLGLPVGLVVVTDLQVAVPTRGDQELLFPEVQEVRYFICVFAELLHFGSIVQVERTHPA